MANFFDQFDHKPAAPKNFFDQFDEQHKAGSAAGEPALDGVNVGDHSLAGRMVNPYTVTAAEQLDSGKYKKWDDIPEAELEANARSAGYDPSLLKTRARLQVRRKLFPEIAKAEDDVAAGLTSSALQGLTLGGMDEITAKVAETGGADYDTSLDFIRQKDAKFREANPGLAIGAELAGGAVLPMGAIGALGKSASWLDRTKNLAKASGVGAAYGAAYGFGSGEGGFDQRLENSGNTALVGALVPPAIKGGVALTKGVTAVPKAIAAPILNRFRNADDLANKEIIKALERSEAPSVASGKDHLVPDDIKGFVGYANDAGHVGNPVADALALRMEIADDLKLPINGTVDNPSPAVRKKIDKLNKLEALSKRAPIDVPVMLADISEPMAQLAGRAKRVPGRGASVVEAGMVSRQHGTQGAYDDAQRRLEAFSMADQDKVVDPAWKRVSKSAGRALGLDGEADGFGEFAAAKAKRKSAANRWFEGAYNLEKPFDPRSALVRLGNEIADLPQDSYNKILNMARRVVQDVDGEGKLGRMLGNRPGDLKKLQRRKEMVLDEAIAKAKLARENTEVRALTIFKNQLLDDVSRTNPIYRKALQKYRGDSEVVDAFDWGRSVLNDDASPSVAELKAMSEGEREMAKHGIVEALKRLWMRRGEHLDATQVLKRPDVQAVMKEAMADLPRFEKIFELESRMPKTRQIATGGSQTASNQAQDAEMNVTAAMSAAGQMAQGKVASGMMTWAKDIIDKYLGMRSDVAENLARKLTTMDKPAMLRLANQLNRMSNSKSGTKIIREVISKRDLATQLATRAASQSAATAD